MRFQKSTVSSCAGRLRSVQPAVDVAACYQYRYGASRRASRFLRLPCLLLGVVVMSLPAAEPEMVLIPGGEFLRGRSHPLPDDDSTWRPTLLKDDRPAKRIYVDPFYLDEHEVTNEAYLRFLEATGRERPFHWVDGEIAEGEEKHPVVNVNWYEATAYCESLGNRLPTEAEWERAARGVAEGAKFPWGEEEPNKGEQAHFNVLDGPCEVCRFPKNTFGLCDIAGNVWEWCFDRYERLYYEWSPEKNPRGPDEGMYRMLRGGSWADAAKYLTCAYRSFARPRERSPNIGFRCAKGFSQRL